MAVLNRLLWPYNVTRLPTLCLTQWYCASSKIGYPIRHHHPSPPARLAVTPSFSCPAPLCLPWSEVLPYRSIRVDLTTAVKDGWGVASEEDFKQTLTSHLETWRAENRSGVWLSIPTSLAHLIPRAGELGFSLHHASQSRGEVVMNKWLREGRPNKLPHYASHQVGVCGVVYRDDTQEVLVVQDKFKPPFWKFPGGLSEHGEDIAATAVREVHEETGVVSEFRSILAFRQQHHLPNAFDTSDLYFICRVEPLTFDLHPCEDEVLQCQWMSLDELAVSSETTQLSHRVASLLLEGRGNGFHTVDLVVEEWPSIYHNMTYKLFLRSR